MTEQELNDLAENMDWLADRSKRDGYAESATAHANAARVCRAMAALTGADRKSGGKWQMVMVRNSGGVSLDSGWDDGKDTPLEAIECWAEGRR